MAKRRKEPTHWTDVGRAYLLESAWRTDCGTVASGTRIVVLEHGKDERHVGRAAQAERGPSRVRVTVADESSPWDGQTGWIDEGQIEPLPPCIVAMGCYCAGHARGDSASEPCNT